ncbi:LCP family protein [Tomitella fengzijianii]|uniref:LCP family glycopolymer transferase n=1 Tax=Tomitella fengzijianii TaxID=2597660 RepID=UPI001E659749|nr:LCP family protein [Tomitella fengzijianii]
MTDDHRFTAPWERPLSRVRGEESPPAAAPDDTGRGVGDEGSPGLEDDGDPGREARRSASGQSDADGGRRRLSSADQAPHGRVTVADLIARIGHPGQAPSAPGDTAPPGSGDESADPATGPEPDTASAPSAPSDAGAPPRRTPPDAPAYTAESTAGSPAGSAPSDPAGRPHSAHHGDKAPPDDLRSDGPPQDDSPQDDSPQDDDAHDGEAAADVGIPHAADGEAPRPTPETASWIRSALPLSIPGRLHHGRAGHDRHPSYWLRVSHVAIALVSVLSLVVTGAVWSYLRITDSQYTQVSALDQNSDDVRNPAGQFGDENYLIIGTDTRAGANSEVGAGSSTQVEGARSDTIMLVNIPADRSRVVGVSFPRDLNVDRPSCERWDNSSGTYTDEIVPAQDDVKLNSAYAFGGPRCLVQVIQKLSGIKVNHFLGMDFAGFEAMVDTVGGVEVCTTRPLVDDELGTILPEPGTQTISGTTALEYVRARKVEAEGNGDYGRIKRQQMFLSSLLRKALSHNVLLDPGKLNSFINEFIKASFGDNLDTQALITLGRSLQNVDADQVTFLTAPTDGTDAWGNETPRLQDIRNIFDAIIDDEPLPGEQRADARSAESTSAPAAPATAGTEGADAAGDPDTTQVHAVAPGTISVQVSNASSIGGFASSTADELGAEGFQIYSIGNHTAPVTGGTIVQFSGDNLAAAATVASAFPGARLQRTTGLGSIVEVLLSDTSSQSTVTPQSTGSVLTPMLAGDSSEEGSVPLDVSVVNAGDTSCS